MSADANAPLSMPEMEMDVSLSRLEPFAVDALDATAQVKSISDRLDSRAAKHLGFTFLLRSIGITPQRRSLEYMRARAQEDASKRIFAEEYERLYPNEPLGQHEVEVVISAVIDLSDAGLSLRFEE